MARVVRFHRTGGPEVLQFDDLPVGDPKPGEMRVRIEAIGLNRAEAMFRSCAYLEPPCLPARLGVDAHVYMESNAQFGKIVVTVSDSHPSPRRARPRTADTRGKTSAVARGSCPRL
ncbi:hypothetical protein ACU4GR_09250 (plasmid) [Methylobacterium oryzae CBMB20]|jgi:hypothetical protein